MLLGFTNTLTCVVVVFENVNVNCLRGKRSLGREIFGGLHFAS